MEGGEAMNDACCSHSKVVLKHIEYPGGSRSDYWECESGCGATFYPAFTDQAGIRLRDWLAGMALQGLLASPRTLNGKNKLSENDLAGASYGMADAMLQERMKPKP